MPVAAGISAAGAIGSAGIGAVSSYEASKQQTQAAQAALQFQQQVFNTNQSNLSPFINNGTNAMYSLASLYGLPTPNNPSGGAGATNAAFDAFTKLPAYQFPLQQGNLALSDQLNAQGKQQSGAQARETQQFGQGLASTYLMSNYVNPLLSLAGQGQGAASSLANANVASGSQVGQSYGNIGTAQAAGTMGIGNSLSGGLSGGANSLALYSALSNGGSSYAGVNAPNGISGTGIGPTSMNGGLETFNPGGLSA